MSQLKSLLKHESVVGSGLSEVQKSMPPAAHGNATKADMFQFVPVPGQLGNAAPSHSIFMSKASASKMPLVNPKEIGIRTMNTRLGGVDRLSVAGLKKQISS